MARDYPLHPVEPPRELRIAYARELNPEQYAAVSAGNGPSLVLAGAGSGKTRTLTYRVAWLLEHGVPPERILLLTFTNKAAREMMRRVSDLLPGDLSRLVGGTFHSVGLRFLRRHADRIGYAPDFTIADREDSRDLLATCIEEAGVDTTASRFPKADVLLEVFSMAANRCEPLSHLLRERHPYFSEIADAIQSVAAAYATRKRATGTMDFDDLLSLWLGLLRSDAELRDFYQNRFRHVLVDEYQDTNKLQGEIIDLLAQRHRNIMAVGDDSQSIYSWRGAEFRNILEFNRRFPDASIHRVETNYRSTPEILDLANAAIARNTRQFPKKLTATRASGQKPALVPCFTAGEQAGFIAQRTLELRDEGIPLAEMAVLYRSHFHAMELQMELTRRNIPFLITSGIRFFEQAHIKDVTAYLKILANPHDELALKRIVRMLPGVGPRAAEKLWQRYHSLLPPPLPSAAAAPPAESWDADESPPTPPPTPDPAVRTASVSVILGKIQAAVPKKAAAAWARLAATLAELEKPEPASDPPAMIRHIVDADYADYAHATFENADRRLEDIEQLAEYSRQFRSLSELLQQLALASEIESAATARQAGGDDAEDCLRLSTIHQAKGLEFKVVFVIMLCDGLFPSVHSLESTDAEEEERRLFYVAVTRARDELYLTYPLLRFTRGGGDASQLPSRFIHEIPEPLLEAWNLHPHGTPNPRTLPDSEAQPDAPEDEPF